MTLLSKSLKTEFNVKKDGLISKTDKIIIIKMKIGIFTVGDINLNAKYYKWNWL